MVGVVAIPSRMGLQPTEPNDLITSDSISAPELLVSRPITIFCPIIEPKALAYEFITSGVSPSTYIPLKPDSDAFRGVNLFVGLNYDPELCRYEN